MRFLLLNGAPTRRTRRPRSCSFGLQKRMLAAGVTGENELAAGFPAEELAGSLWGYVWGPTPVAARRRCTGGWPPSLRAFRRTGAQLLGLHGRDEHRRADRGSGRPIPTRWCALRKLALRRGEGAARDVSPPAITKPCKRRIAPRWLPRAQASRSQRYFRIGLGGRRRVRGRTLQQSGQRESGRDHRRRESSGARRVHARCA